MHLFTAKMSAPALGGFVQVWGSCESETIRGHSHCSQLLGWPLAGPTANVSLLVLSLCLLFPTMPDLPSFRPEGQRGSATVSPASQDSQDHHRAGIRCKHTNKLGFIGYKLAKSDHNLTHQHGGWGRTVLSSQANGFLKGRTTSRVAQALVFQ